MGSWCITTFKSYRQQLASCLTFAHTYVRLLTLRLKHCTGKNTSWRLWLGSRLQFQISSVMWKTTWRGFQLSLVETDHSFSVWSQHWDHWETDASSAALNPKHPPSFLPSCHHSLSEYGALFWISCCCSLPNPAFMCNPISMFFICPWTGCCGNRISLL